MRGFCVDACVCFVFILEGMQIFKALSRLYVIENLQSRESLDKTV